MALIECQECKKQISSSADFCPHCGCKPTKPKPKPSGCSVILFGFISIILYNLISTRLENNSNSSAVENKSDNQTNSKSVNVRPNTFPVPDSCLYLESLGGYTPNNYESFDKGSSEYICGTPYKEIGTHPDLELANNISYYVTGDAVQGDRLKLILNVNQKSNAKSAKAELLKAVSVVYLKVYKSDLPANIKNAIVNGRAGKWDDQKYLIELEKNIWPGNKGYDINFIISVK